MTAAAPPTVEPFEQGATLGLRAPHQLDRDMQRAPAHLAALVVPPLVVSTTLADNHGGRHSHSLGPFARPGSTQDAASEWIDFTPRFQGTNVHETPEGAASGLPRLNK